MRILLLGATGRTGKFALNYALQKGYEVNCLVRHSERIRPCQGLKIFEGNPQNQKDLETAMTGCQVIISILNISRNSDFPWARLKTPQNYMSEVMKTVVPLAYNNNITRLIACSAWGVSETEKDIPGWFRWFIHHSNIGVAYRDHERQEKVITNSNLPWTIIRPVGLTNTQNEQKIMESFDDHPKPSLTISRRSLAGYLVDCIDKDELTRKKVVISKA